MDEHHLTHEPGDEGDALWSTPEEERTFSLIRDLLMEMHDHGRGIYIAPVREGQAGGLGASEPYGVDGWVVGQLGPSGGQDLAVGPWLDQVVAAAREAAR